jgi:hypothetical protein
MVTGLDCAEHELAFAELAFGPSLGDIPNIQPSFSGNEKQMIEAA